jgi:hypothetical protein
MAQTNVERNGSRGKRSRRGSCRNNGASVEFELACFLSRPSEARVLRKAPASAPLRGAFRALVTSAAPPHIPDMVRIAISQAAFDAIASTMALGMILLAAPAYAGSRFGGGFHGGGGFSAFHRSGGRARGFFGGFAYGYGCGYNCGFGFDSGGYDNGNGNGYGGGAGNAVSISNGLTGSYVPDPVGADIPPLIIPTNCWVRRPAYDPSGAYFGQVLVNLCRLSDSVTVTGLKAGAKTPGTETGRQAIDQGKP